MYIDIHIVEFQQQNKEKRLQIMSNFIRENCAIFMKHASMIWSKTHLSVKNNRLYLINTIFLKRFPSANQCKNTDISQISR